MNAITSQPQEVQQIVLAFPNWFYSWFAILSSVVVIGGALFIGRLYQRIKDICDDHPKIRQALTRISEILLQKDFAKDLVYAQSPVGLTPEGQRILKEAKFDEFYFKNRELLIERIKKSNPKNIAELEEACKSLMLSIEETLPLFENIRQYAYQHGEPISKVLFAASIDLRDKLVRELGIKA